MSQPPLTSRVNAVTDGGFVKLKMKFSTYYLYKMICKHNIEKQYCRNGCSNRYCEHNVNKYQCKKCGGGSICEHSRIRVQCKDCNGSQVCEHQKRKSRCKECNGGSICEHNRDRHRCKDCSGGSICEHKIQKQCCKKCGGSSICEHNKINSRCKECSGASICEHNRVKYTCVDCKGNGVCEHNRRRAICKDCGGSNLCKHNKQKYQCIICTPNTKYYCTLCRLFGGVLKDNNYLCSYCNPNKSSRRKTKEERVKQLLSDNNLKFIYDKMITNECCLKYRPDFLFDCGNYFVILECDEDAHTQYDKDCEIIRMNNICISIGLPTKFIRYNPDKKGIKINKKEEILLKTLQNELYRESLDDLAPIYLFY